MRPKAERTLTKKPGGGGARTSEPRETDTRRSPTCTIRAKQEQPTLGNGILLPKAVRSRPTPTNQARLYRRTTRLSSLTHLEHKRPLDDAAAHPEHPGEEAREEADARVPDRVEGGPLHVPLDVRESQLGLQAPPVDEVLAHPPFSANTEPSSRKVGREGAEERAAA